ALWGLRVISTWVTALLFVRLLLDLRHSSWVGQALPLQNTRQRPIEPEHDLLHLGRGLLIGGVVALALLLGLPHWESLNTPERYALPLQLVCLLAGFRWLQQPDARGWAFVAGLATGGALLAKQTTSGVLLALGLVVLLWARERLRDPRGLLALGGGVLAGPGLLALYFAVRGALDEAIDATWGYNRYYMRDLVPGDIVRSALDSDAVQAIYLPLALFAVLGAAQAFRPVADNDLDARWRSLLQRWLALTVVIDLVLTNASGRGYGHYFLTPLPAFLALSTVGLGWWLARWQASPVAWGRAVRAGSWAFVVLAVGGPFVGELVLTVSVTDGHLFGAPHEFPPNDAVRWSSDPDDTVLSWGHAGEVNFGTGRRSPSRYHYSHPLVMTGYADADRLTEFVAELEKNTPRLIVDTSWYDVGKVPPLDPARYPRWLELGGDPDLPDLEPVRAFWANHCTTVVAAMEDILVYRCAYD
ncbi:MAG: hypothetical protein GYB65_12900, partial [Chloroflexi bacterium]|nr:hypothetical protein [Chloroflexota bacterium]